MPKNIISTLQKNAKSMNIDLSKKSENNAEIEKLVSVSLNDFLKENMEHIKIYLNHHNNIDIIMMKDISNKHFLFNSILDDMLFKSLLMSCKTAYLMDLESNNNNYELLMSLSTFNYQCDLCGERIPLVFDFEALEVKPIYYPSNTTSKNKNIEKCPVYDTNHINSMKLDLSDGKILIANDLRKLFGSREKVKELEEKFLINKGEGVNYISLNHLKGRSLNTEFWAQQGLMYFQSDNISPNYYMNEKDNHIVFKMSPDEDGVIEKTKKSKEKYLGYVITDLWAIHAMSMTTFSNLCKGNKLNESEMIEILDIGIYDVVKGIYKCTSYFEVIDDDMYDDSVPIIRIELIE